MTRATRIILIAGAAVAALGLVNGAQSQNAMTFFVTSAGPGNGGDLGGLDGADAALPDARAGGRRERQDLARLSVDAGRERRERQGSHRARARGRTPRAR